MPPSAFSRAPSRIFYTIRFYKFCLSGNTFQWAVLWLGKAGIYYWRGRGDKSEGYESDDEMNPEGLTKKF